VDDIFRGEKRHSHAAIAGFYVESNFINEVHNRKSPKRALDRGLVQQAQQYLPR
jgi:hypothetical protein